MDHQGLRVRMFALAALFCEYATGHDRELRPEPATVEIAPLSEPRRELAGVPG